MNKRVVLMLGAGVVMIAVAGALLYTRNARDVSATGKTARAPVVVLPSGPAGGAADAGPAVIKFVKNPQPMPDFTVRTLDGRTLTPADLRGKAVIINFWATWCGPCKAEIPEFIALQKKYAGRLEIVGLSVDEAPQRQVAAFVKAHDMNYAIAIAPDKVQASFGGIYGIPTSFIVDQQGRIVQKHIGLTSSAVFEREVRAVMGLPVHAKIEHVIDSASVNPVNAPPVTRIPGIDLTKLTPTQRAKAIKLLNTETCTCGCGETVARCRVTDPSCPVSLAMAKHIIAEVTGQQASN